MKGIHTKLFVFVALLVTSCVLYAQFPAKTSASISHLINFQGKLTNPDGTNVTDGNYPITFSIYSVSSGGTAIWTETQSTVGVSAGIFQVALGSVTALPGSVDFNTSSLYLGVKVAADPEMTPRVQFTAVPYAFNADALGGVLASGYGTLAGVQTWSAANTFSGLVTANGGASILTGLNNNSGGITNAGSIAGVAGLTFSSGTLNVNSGGITNTGSIGGVTGITFTSGSLNLNSGGIANTGSIAGATSITLSGAISGGTSFSGSGNISTSAGSINAAAGALQTSNTDRIDSSGNLKNIGNLTGTGAVNITSTGGTNDLSLTSGSGTLNISATTVKTTGGLTYNLTNATDDTFTITNSDATHVANLGVEGSGTFGTGLTVSGGGASITGNSSIAGTLTGLTGLTVVAGTGASISSGLNNNGGGITNAGTIGGITGLTFTSGALNLNNGGITNTGSIAGATSITLNGAISGGTSFSGSGNITTSAGNVNATAGTIQTNGTDRIKNNGDLSNIGNITGTGALTLSSTGGTNDLTLTSGSSKVVLNATTVKTAAGLTYDLNNVADDTFTITNSDGTHVAGLSVEGAGTFGTGVTVSAGGITATGNSTITGTLGGLTGLTVASGGAGITGTTSVTGGNFTISQTGTGAALIVNRTDGVVSSLKSGLTKSTFVFDSSGSFGIAADTRANIISGTGSGTDAITILGTNNNVGISNTSPGATFSVGTGDLFQVAGASGNFQTSGTGLVKTTNANAFQVQNSSGTALLKADTSATKVTITGAAQVTGALQVGSLQIGSSATAGDILITDASGNLSFVHPAVKSVYNSTTLTSGNNIIWTGLVTTNGGATTVCLTTNGVCTGTAIFPTTIFSIMVTGVGGTTAINAPMGTVRSISADRRTLVITLQTGVNLGLGGNTTAFAANGTTAYVEVIGN